MKKKKIFLDRRDRFFVENKNESTEIPKNCLIELTNACNHECIFCHNPTMQRKITRLDFEDYKIFIDQLAFYKFKELGLYTTGEPFMIKDLDKYIEYAKKQNIPRVYITTNGSLANISKVIKCINAGLDSIKFSINSSNRKNYKIIHGKDDYDKVLKNVNDILDYKKKNKLNLELIASFVVTSLNQNETLEFQKNFKETFDEIIFCKASNHGGRNIDRAEILTKNLTNKSALDLCFNHSNENVNMKKKIEPCDMIWSRLHLSSDKKLTACCMDYEHDLVYANFDKDTDLKKEFNNQIIKNLRKKHLNNKLNGTICKNCLHNTNEVYKPIYEKEVENNSNPKKIVNLNNRIDKFYK